MIAAGLGSVGHLVGLSFDLRVLVLVLVWM